MIDALMPLAAMYALIVIAILMWPEMRAARVIIREIWRTWLLRNWRLIATGDYLAWAIDARRTGPPFCEWCNDHIDDDGDCACVDDFKLCPNMDCMAVVADESTHCSLCGTRISQRFTEDDPRDSLASIIRDLQDLSDTAHLELRDRARLAAIISRLEQLP